MFGLTRARQTAAVVGGGPKGGNTNPPPPTLPPALFAPTVRPSRPITTGCAASRALA